MHHRLVHNVIILWLTVRGLFHTQVAVAALFLYEHVFRDSPSQVLRIQREESLTFEPCFIRR